MAKNEINKKILDFIDQTDYDKDIKLFLKDCLDIEFNRVKTGTDKYFNEYDKKVEKYVE